MRIRPLEVWVFSLFLVMIGVGAYHQYLADQRAKEPVSPYSFSMTVKAHR